MAGKREGGGNKDEQTGGRWTAAQVQSSLSNLSKGPFVHRKASAFVPWWHKRVIHSENLFVSDTITQQTLLQSSSFHANYLEQGSY